ncbi:phosphotransferase [Planctomycetaceae bacterium SH139]
MAPLHPVVAERLGFVSTGGMKLTDEIRQLVLDSTAATAVSCVTKVQSLWSGYGQICRVELRGGAVDCVIVKHVAPLSKSVHPRGWSSDRSHARKLRSYEVEANWYANFSSLCHPGCRVPKCLATSAQEGEFLFVLEDLDAAGYSHRRSHLDHAGVRLGLKWLAQFHARFLGVAPTGLWKIGTYWHLATRPDELDAMDPGALKDAAAAIDAQLNQCRYQTIVHGDAKVANFCFTADSTGIAAVDFQYVGGGCGMKDVAYFLGSCLPERECEQHAAMFLDTYFAELSQAISQRDPSLPIDEIESEWRFLYPFAWADFTRFMLGWCPTHTKLNAYTRRISEQVTRQIKR